MKKQHAIHNEEACDFLLASKKFNDWVITTAFYSALHYVQHELFPLTEQGKTYSEFTIYYGKVMKQRNRKLSKHTATIQLVKIRLSTCAPYYRWLHDACMNARYSSYIVSAAKAQTAKDYLVELKNLLKNKL